MDFDRLTFTDVTRNFGRRRALNRVSLTCRSGEIVALIGPNGAGKSTLLSIAATVLQPTSGIVEYGGSTARRAGAALRARIGLLGHDLYLYPELTAAENLRFFARLYGLPAADRAVAEALERAGLADRGDELVSSFSRGMRQRLAIERALLHAPRLALLDEPFTGLDDAAATGLQGRLAALRQAGCIVLITTHDLETIEGVLDRAVFVVAGRATEIEKHPGVPLRQQYPQHFGRIMTFLRTVWLVMQKDLLIEFRSREILYTTAFFAVSAVLVFAFGFVQEGEPTEGVGAGILWIAIAFSGTLALGRAFERERLSETLRALMMAPVERAALYVAKLLGVVVLLLAVEVLVVPLVAVLFQARMFGDPVTLVALLMAGTLGFASVGTLFAAMLVRARSRDVLLPILLYPITVPVIIAGVRGTAALLQTEMDIAVARAWLSMLVFFDVVFITLALWTFEPLMTD